MKITSPVTFDNGMVFSPDGRTHSWNKMNGYDSAGCRITNIVGHDGSDFLKKCSRGGCGIVLRAVEFGPAGRDTNGPRDQSNCADCRSNY